jgi:polyphosphate:AMP phosphotransferase
VLDGPHGIEDDPGVLDEAAAGNRIDKPTFEAAVPDLRVRLLNAQFDLSSADFPVVVFVGGDDRVGANELVNRLNEWLDSRFMDTHVFTAAGAAGQELPPLAGLWHALPPHGRIGLFVGGLFRRVLAHLDGDISEGELARWCAHLRSVQEQWVADGALVLKFYVHTPADLQRRRLKKSKKRDDAWRYDSRDWEAVRDLPQAVPVVERVLRETSAVGARWTVVEGTDARYRDLTVARTILAALEARLAEPTAPSEGDPAPALPHLGQPATVLDLVDLGAVLPKPDYKRTLGRHQARLHRNADEARRRGIATVLAFEGWDAAGKGGAIRRVTSALEAGDYRVHAVAAPTAEERRYHYLWRFWRHVPRDGRIAIFDRTWYGRVLVERIEGFATPAEWQRAYDEILDFEEQLVEHGTVVAKFWLHISPEEQLARFEARRETPYKKHKITEEDLRNRQKWPDYVAAVDEMVVRTSTPEAPWHVVAGNDKRHARVEVVRLVADALERRLD